jgi:hypothetical protein
MATTSRFGLHYQALTDAPDGAALGGLLAGDVDTWLARAYPVADANARTALSGVAAGFLVLQLDDNTFWGWNGATWVGFGDGTTGGGGGGGGGGSGTFIEGQWRATANQAIPNSTDTVLGFGTTETTSAVVTRATSGAGHKFTLANTATYAITAVVRFAAGSAGSRFIELRNSAQNTGYVADGDQGGPAAATRHFSLTKQFTAGTELVVIGAQTSGGSLSTEYQGTSPTVYRVRLTIVQLG